MKNKLLNNQLKNNKYGINLSKLTTKSKIFHPKKDR
jgi:hypothetical protein